MSSFAQPSDNEDGQARGDSPADDELEEICYFGYDPTQDTEETPLAEEEDAPDEEARQKFEAIKSKFSVLDKIGLHHVELTRGARRIERDLYLDDYDGINSFLDKAVAKLQNPDDDPQHLRWSLYMMFKDQDHAYGQHFDHAELEWMAEAVSGDVEWLWPGRIGAGKLTMLLGEPGIGKSLVTLDIAARVSTGRPWPDQPVGVADREAGGVLLLAETDDPADTIHPRLTALGADLERIALLRTFIKSGAEPVPLPFSLAGNLNVLEDAIARMGDCKLVIIDPLSMYVEGKHPRPDITELLGYLIETSVKTDVAILVVSHFSRGGPSVFRYGSQTNARFVAAARSVWQIVGDGRDRQRRLLVPMKNSLGRDWLGLAFRVESCADPPTARIRWEDKLLEMDVDRTTLNPDSESRSLPNSFAEHRRLAGEWLKQQLIEGERLSQDVLAAARLAKIGQRTLRRALREIGGITRRGPSGQWLWALNAMPIIHIPDRTDENEPSKLLDYTRHLEEVEHVEHVEHVERVNRVERVDQVEHVEELERLEHAEHREITPLG